MYKPNQTPPVCKNCSYPPDSQRVLLIFETISGMLNFINKKHGLDPEDYSAYDNEDLKGFLMICPSWKCEKGFEVDSIEVLTKIFDWNPTELDPQSEEFKARVFKGRFEDNLFATQLLELIKEK